MKRKLFSSRKNFVMLLIIVFVSLITISIVIILSLNVVSIRNSIAPASGDLIAAIIGFVGVAGGAVISAVFALYQNRVTRAQEAIYKDAVDLLLQEAEDVYEKKIQQLNIEKQQVAIKQQQLEIEREQYSLGWQKEALMLADISPRAAIIIAWTGIEQDLQHAVENVSSFRKEEDSTKMGSFNSSKSIKVLQADGQIDPEIAKTLMEMSKLRNEVAHGMISEERITNSMAVEYVQQAINIAQKISSIGS